MRKRPKTVFLLMVVFAWSLWKGIELLARGSTTADRILFDEAGIGWLAVVMIGAIIVLDAAALRYLIRPAPAGRIVCLVSIALSAVQTAIGFAIARAYPDIARRALIVSRESRGLSVRPEAVDLATNPTIMLLLWIGSLLLSVLLAFLVIRQWNYFSTRESGPPLANPMAARP